MKTIKFIFTIIVSVVVAMVAGIVVFAVTDSDRAFLSTILFGTALCALALGAYDEREETKHESIRHYDGRRNYGQAAVFIGTACLFVGTPQQCEELADDMQHYAQQVRVDTLTGEETNFEIL